MNSNYSIPQCLMSMFKILSLQNIHMISVLSLFLLVFSSSVKADISIGVVNVSHVMENAPQSARSSIKLKAKFVEREQKISKQQSEIAFLEKKKSSEVLDSNNETKARLEREIRTKKRAHSRALEDFREELRFARDAALDEVQKEVYEAISIVRVQRGIDIIIQEYVSASARVDITEDVLVFLREKINKKQMNKISPDNEKGNNGSFNPQ